jgi:hypothetical protein
MVLASRVCLQALPDKPQIAAMASGVFFLCHIEKKLSTELTSTVITFLTAAEPVAATGR